MFPKPPPLTPETLTILPLAVGIDLASWLLLLIGLDDFGLLDIAGTTVVGTWLLIRRGKPSLGKKPQLDPLGLVRGIYTGRFTKFLTPIVNEITPYWGAIVPAWTLSVYFNLIE